jgi:predicted enzyme related to lactoylglutathione lyase
MVMQSDYISPVVQRLEDTKSPILNTISTIFINVTNMNRSIQFHNEVLGLQSREVRPGPENSIYSLSMNKGSEVLLDDNRFRNGEDYKILCMFAAKNIDDSKAYLELNGVQIFTDIERYGSVAFFTVEDPDGNVIMICSEAN